MWLGSLLVINHK